MPVVSSVRRRSPQSCSTRATRGLPLCINPAERIIGSSSADPVQWFPRKQAWIGCCRSASLTRLHGIPIWPGGSRTSPKVRALCSQPARHAASVAIAQQVIRFFRNRLRQKSRMSPFSHKAAALPTDRAEDRIGGDPRRDEAGVLFAEVAWFAGSLCPRSIAEPVL